MCIIHQLTHAGMNLHTNTIVLNDLIGYIMWLLLSVVWSIKQSAIHDCVKMYDIYAV